MVNDLTRGDTSEMGIALGRALVRAVAGRDSAELSEHLDGEARLRALLPADTVEVVGRVAVVAKFADWFGDFDSTSLIGSSSDMVGDRLLVGYQLELAKDERRWLCAQEAFCSVSEGRVLTMDLVCSGFRRTAQ
ncbi:MAG: hypothetical protein ACRDV9_14130 [Acidimicrobiia bacterium]